LEPSLGVVHQQVKAMKITGVKAVLAGGDRRVFVYQKWQT
jgi:hypothetical protein